MPYNEPPEIPADEYEKPLPKGGELPPLELLPTRAWINARIAEVKFQYAVFNGKIQYMTKKEPDPETNREIDVQILDDSGQPIPRRQFAITFELLDYQLPNGNPRKAWLTLGATLGEKAHLPTFIYNVLGPEFVTLTPKIIIDALTGKHVKLQLKNKPNTKDPTLPPRQEVVYDAVEAMGQIPRAEPPEPIEEIDEPTNW